MSLCGNCETLEELEKELNAYKKSLDYGADVTIGSLKAKILKLEKLELVEHDCNECGHTTDEAVFANKKWYCQECIDSMVKYTPFLEDEYNQTHTEKFKELQRLAEIGEALELFETTELDYDGTINNIKVLLAWYRNEVKDEI